MENKIENIWTKLESRVRSLPRFAVLDFRPFDALACNRAQLSDQRCCQVGGVFIFIFVTFNKILAGISVAGLVIASIINVLFSHSLRNLAHD
jgi:hypothetical protein